MRQGRPGGVPGVDGESGCGGFIGRFVYHLEDRKRRSCPCLLFLFALFSLVRVFSFLILLAASSFSAIGRVETVGITIDFRAWDLQSRNCLCVFNDRHSVYQLLKLPLRTNLSIISSAYSARSCSPLLPVCTTSVLPAPSLLIHVRVRIVSLSILTVLLYASRYSVHVHRPLLCLLTIACGSSLPCGFLFPAFELCFLYVFLSCFPQELTMYIEGSVELKCCSWEDFFEGERLRLLLFIAAQTKGTKEGKGGQTREFVCAPSIRSKLVHLFQRVFRPLFGLDTLSTREVVRRGAGKTGSNYSSVDAESDGPVFRPHFLPDSPSLADASILLVDEPHVSLAVRECS